MVEENCWLYNNIPICEIPEGDWYGFVYKISKKNTGEYYWGCKSFYNITNPKISKKKANELYTGKGRKKTRLQKIKESDWKDYLSSSKKVQEMIEIDGLDAYKFEIISFHKSYTSMMMEETFLILKDFISGNTKILNEWLSIKIRKPNVKIN
jgi:hypothetical protein